ncbi:MAG: protein kinase [Longimicrobiales bacterium]
MAIAPGTKIGNYEIQAPLGEGGMGAVYQAHDPTLQRTVAIKVLAKQDEDASTRLLQEARAASALNHPHICTIYEVGEHEGQAFIVMEHVEGKTLSALIPADGLPPESVIRYGTQIADALAHAHERGIVHRDLKSANVVITPEGRAKVLDFGLAARMPQADAEAVTKTQEALPHAGMLVGTLAYMAPEVLRGEAATARSDIWALGVLLYEMASGRLPFGSGSFVEVSATILKESPGPLPIRISPGVRALVRRSLSKESGQRYASAGELQAALEVVVPSDSSDARSTGREETRPSIAVLPFANMSTDPENEYFCDGITEDIINALTRLKGLRVMARTSSFSFKGTNPEIAEVAAKLNVATILEGSVRRAGNRLRVTAQLVNAADSYQIWSERFDRDLEDVFAIQDEIATTIAERLKVTLTDKGSEPVVVRPTDNLEAYELYVKGRVFFYQRGTSLLSALECFERAVELDPNYAHAWAGLADTRTSMGQWGVKPPGETIPAALEAAHRALALGPDLPEAHNARAYAASNNREWQTAEREFLRALELNPNHVQARCWYGVFYLGMVSGRWEDGLVQIRRALDLDPLSAYATAMYGLALSCAGHYPEAIEQLRLAVERDPVSFICRWVLQVNYLLAGHFSDSIEAGERALALSGRHVFALCQQVTAYARWGKTREARAVHNELLARAEQGYVQPTLLALSAVAVGDVADAVARAQAAYEERDCFLIVANRFPFCSDLQAIPRVQAIFDRLGAPNS